MTPRPLQKPAAKATLNRFIQDRRVSAQRAESLVAGWEAEAERRGSGRHAPDFWNEAQPWNVEELDIKERPRTEPGALSRLVGRTHLVATPLRPVAGMLLVSLGLKGTVELAIDQLRPGGVGDVSSSIVDPCSQVVEVLAAPGRLTLRELELHNGSRAKFARLASRSHIRRHRLLSNAESP